MQSELFGRSLLAVPLNKLVALVEGTAPAKDSQLILYMALFFSFNNGAFPSLVYVLQAYKLM